MMRIFALLLYFWCLRLNYCESVRLEFRAIFKTVIFNHSGFPLGSCCCYVWVKFGTSMLYVSLCNSSVVACVIPSFIAKCLCTICSVPWFTVYEFLCELYDTVIVAYVSYADTVFLILHRFMRSMIGVYSLTYCVKFYAGSRCVYWRKCILAFTWFLRQFAPVCILFLVVLILFLNSYSITNWGTIVTHQVCVKIVAFKTNMIRGVRCVFLPLASLALVGVVHDNHFLSCLDFFFLSLGRGLFWYW
jgi:hypothetical protein